MSIPAAGRTLASSHAADAAVAAADACEWPVCRSPHRRNSACEMSETNKLHKNIHYDFATYKGSYKSKRFILLGNIYFSSCTDLPRLSLVSECIVREPKFSFVVVNVSPYEMTKRTTKMKSSREGLLFGEGKRGEAGRGRRGGQARGGRRESGIKESTFRPSLGGMIDSVILFGILLAIYSPSQKGRKINLPWRARAMVGGIKVLKLDLIASGIFL